MKKSKWDKKYKIVFSDGEKFTATGAMCDFMCIAFHEAAVSLNKQGDKRANIFQKKANEIYSQLTSFGFYKGFLKEMLK